MRDLRQHIPLAPGKKVAPRKIREAVDVSRRQPLIGRDSFANTLDQTLAANGFSKKSRAPSFMASTAIAMSD